MFKLIKLMMCSLLFLFVQTTVNATITLDEKKGPSNWMAFKKGHRQPAKDLVQNKTALSLKTNDNLWLSQSKKDNLDFQHYRYQQYYKDLPVEGAVYWMHEKGGKVALSNGRLVHDLNIQTQPSIGIEYAKQIALQYIECDSDCSHNPTGLNESAIKKVSKVIFDPHFTLSASNYHLAYKIEIRDIQSLILKDVYIDAHKGNVVLSLNKIHQCTDIDASGPTNYSDTISFTACQVDENTYALKSTIGDSGYLEVLDYGVPFSTLITDVEPPFEDTPTANEVMWASQHTFDYFLNTHQRPYPDTLTQSIVHYISPQGYTNRAFYADGLGVFFGDGGDETDYNSLTSVDIVAHELAHGVTNFSADLIYIGQPGALSESFSDIFGEMVENEVKGVNDWIIGSEVVRADTINGMRNMSNPKDTTMLFKLPDTYFGKNWKNLPKDNEGVHYNCGVHNYWFYLLSEGNTGTNDNNYNYNVEGIGKDKAAAIAYRNLTYYLTPTSHYEDAKSGSIQAAKDLFPKNTNILNQIIEAWNAVGLTDCRTTDSIALRKWGEGMQFKDTVTINWMDQDLFFEEWDGITLNEEGCVVKLDLSNLQLADEIPSLLGSLKHLKTLNLRNNDLQETIPSSLGNLSNLEVLLLDSNRLKGSLPGTFQYLESLKELNVSYNRLEGCYEAPLDSLCDLLNSSSKIDEGNQFIISWESFCAGQICKDCRLKDSLSLLKLYEVTDGINWTNTWNLNEPISTWYGVIFDENNCVEELNLINNNLTGFIPAEIGDLSSLQFLYLGDNRLQGSIPYELVNIDNIIDIDLSNNLLSGCYNANLDTLYNKWNNVFNCDTKGFSDGNFFDASWCDFITSGIGSCENYSQMSCRQIDSLSLLKLYEATNGVNWENKWNLNEPIDQWYGVVVGHQNCVTNVILEGNYLEGFIPDQIGYLSKLRNLNFSYNNLSGIMPKTIGDLSVLSTLRLQDNQLTGEIPASLGNLETLLYLYVHSNQLTGELPVELSNMRSLRTLSLYDNNLSGTIPSEFGNINNLTKINLSKNNLTGGLPAELGDLPILESLAVYQNQLSGYIPANFSNLTKLEILSLKDNNLKGCYAADLVDLCQQISKKNYGIVSDGNNFEVTWDNFCNLNAGICESPVLPGDFNADGIVNYNDLLYWGLASGTNGPSRPNASIDWAPQNAPDWSNTIQGINGKYQDADGDGVIDEEDLEAFELNYGLTYNMVEADNDDATFAFEMRVDPDGLTQNSFTFNLHIRSLNGSEYIDLHGLSVSLNFSEFEIKDVSINESRSIIPVDQLKTFYNSKTKIFDVGMTKTNGVNTRVGNNDVVVSVVACIEINNLPGGDPPAIVIEGGSLLNKNGDFASTNYSTLLPYLLTGDDVGSLPSTIPLAVTILPHTCENLGAIYINTIDGQSVPPHTYNWSNGSGSSFINHLHTGSYSVIISDDAGRSQNLYFNVEDKRVNCRISNNCTELLVLPADIESGIYQAENIFFNGTLDQKKNVYLKATNAINIGIKTQLENITISIENCE